MTLFSLFVLTSAIYFTVVLVHFVCKQRRKASFLAALQGSKRYSLYLNTDKTVRKNVLRGTFSRSEPVHKPRLFPRIHEMYFLFSHDNTKSMKVCLNHIDRGQNLTGLTLLSGTASVCWLLGIIIRCPKQRMSVYF